MPYSRFVTMYDLYLNTSEIVGVNEVCATNQKYIWTAKSVIQNKCNPGFYASML